jgi:hypothetical protein
MSRHSEARAAHAAQCIEVAEKACTAEERREFLTLHPRIRLARNSEHCPPNQKRGWSRGFQPVKQLFLRA